MTTNPLNKKNNSTPPAPFQQLFIDLVDKILPTKQTSKSTIHLEAKIDKMVYKLYDLTTDEINIIESSK